MSTFLSAPSAYGQSQPLISILPMPVASETAPDINNSGVLGQVVIAGGTAYMLVGMIDGQAQWVSLGGADGEFNALIVTTTIEAGGDITSTGGSLEVSGNIISDLGNLSVDTGFIHAAGNIDSDAEIIAGTDLTAGDSLYVAGDGGVAAAGVLGLTNVTDTDQDAGDLTIKSTTANPGDNAGFIKAYIGGATIWIPYFTDIAP